MTSRDHLRAAARCWERAGFLPEAAESFTTVENWRDAGRCFSQAERHADAALAFSRAGELLLEARERLMAGWPERARFLYERLRSERWDSSSARIEVLLSLGEVEQVNRVAGTSGDREAKAMLARLTNARGRPDLAASWWSEESFAPWNRSLRWLLPPPVAEKSKVWPSAEFGEVTLVPIWQRETENRSWGDRALDWSADGSFFAAALSGKGLARGRIGPEGASLETWQWPALANCARFLPASHAVLVGLYGGEVLLVEEDGSEKPMESLFMPNDVWSITFAPKGDRVATSAGTEPGSVLKVWSWQEGRAQAQVEDLRELVGYSPLAAWSPDGRRLCWSPGPLGQLNRLFLSSQPALEAHFDMITGLAFTADGRFLITASWEGTVVVRDGENGQSLVPPERFSAAVYGATLHPKAALVAVGEGNRLHLLRLHPAKVPRLSRLSEQTLDEHVFSLAFSPDGRHLLVMTAEHLHLFGVDLKP